MDLHANESGCHASGGIFIDDDAHDLAIDQMGEHIATDDQVDLVPLSRMEKSSEGVLLADAADDRGLGVRGETGDLTAKGEEGAAAFLVVLPGPVESSVNVALVAF